MIEVPGATIGRILRPADTAELSAALGEHHVKGEGVLVVGGRTKLAEANRAAPIATAISLERIAGVDVFEPEEGVVHVRAGTPVARVREIVAAEGWELPLDPPGRDATIGGTIATAATGPRAHAFGRVADAVLGLEIVAADGTPSKCGGRVVKNVTGYDLAKLHTGSFGSLGVVVGAWLRLRPQPASRRVLRGRVLRDRETFELARSAARMTSVRACVWSEAPGSDQAVLTLELGGGEAAVDHDTEVWSRAVTGLSTVEPGSIDRLRDARIHGAARASGPFDPGEDEELAAQGLDGCGVRARVLGAGLDGLRERMRAAGFALAIDLGPSVLIARGRVASAEVLSARRREAEALGGRMSFEWLPPAWYEVLDVFGEIPGTRPLATALKQRFDPRRILNPGRFVAGT